MGRAPCCDKVGLKKGPWTPEEDQILINFIQNHGHSNWRALPKQSGLLRCGKSCRLRWINYLRPDIKRGNFTREEEDTIIHLHEVMGNRWSAIAARLPGRTDNEIKNVWHTHLKKRLKEYQTTKSESKNARKSRDNAKNVVTTTIDSTTSGISDNNHVTSSINNNNGSGSSPQQSSTTSDEFSSGTEVSSIELPVHINAITDVQSFDNSMIQDDFPLIDETFWEPLEDQLYNMPSTSEEFSTFVIDDNDDNGLQFETLMNEQETTYDNYHNNVDDQNGPGIFFGDDNMDFWLDVFVQAGGAPELPEF